MSLLVMVFCHLFPISFAFVVGEAARVWPLVAALALFAVLRLLTLRWSVRWLAWLYFAPVLLWQASICRLAFVVSIWGFFLVIAVTIAHAFWRAKLPQSKWALLFSFAAPFLLAVLGFSGAKTLVLTVAVCVVCVPLFLLADHRRISLAASTVFTFVLGWTVLFGGFYWGDQASQCAELDENLNRQMILDRSVTKKGRKILRHGEVNLVEPGCAPDSYLVCSRDDGMFLVEQASAEKQVTQLEREDQIFGLVHRCEQNRVLGVNWEKDALRVFDLEKKQAVGTVDLPGGQPDGLVEAGDELAAITDTRNKIHMFSGDGSELLRSYPNAGARVIHYDPVADSLLTVYNWQVRAFDRQTGRLLRKKFLGSWEIRLAVDSQQRRLYTVAFFLGALFVLDLDSFAILDVHPIPFGSRYVLYDPADDALYVANFLRGQLAKYRAADMKMIWRKPTGPKPRRLRLDARAEMPHLLIGTACGALRLPLP